MGEHEPRPPWRRNATAAGGVRVVARSSEGSGRPYGGRSPSDRRAERRRKLLDAGLTLYGTQGYASTTIAQLCRSAGVAPIKFYDEFSSQEALLVEVCEELIGTTVQQVVAAVELAPADVEARARAGLSAFCHALLDDPRRARVALIEIVGVSSDVEKRRRRFLGLYADVLIDFLRGIVAARGDLLDIDPERGRMLAMVLVGGVNEAIVGYLLDRPRGVSIDDMVDVLTELFVVASEAAAVRPANNAKARSKKITAKKAAPAKPVAKKPATGIAASAAPTARNGPTKAALPKNVRTRKRSS